MPAKGVIHVQRGGRGLGYGGGLGGLSGGPFNGNMMRPQQGNGGGWAFGPMFIPPPPPTSRPPPRVMELAPKQEVKLHEAEKPWKPGRRRGGPAPPAADDDQKSEEEIFVEVLMV